MIFKDYKTNINMFTKCFLTNDNIKLQFEKWKTKLQNLFHACFRRLRIQDSKKKLSALNHLMNEQKEIVKFKHFKKEQIDRLEN